MVNLLLGLERFINDHMSTSDSEGSGRHVAASTGEIIIKAKIWRRRIHGDGDC